MTMMMEDHDDDGRGSLMIMTMMMTIDGRVIDRERKGGSHRRH